LWLASAKEKVMSTWRENRDAQKRHHQADIIMTVVGVGALFLLFILLFT
jgi:hypothetical protein